MCAFTKPVEAGLEFAAWPLHVTVVPWFRLEMPSDELARQCQAVVRGAVADSPFEVRMDGIEFFGRHGNKRVNLVRQPTPFNGIEAQVRQFLHQHDAWLADETTSRGRLPYRPHVTAQGTKHLSKGNTFRCGQLYVVEQLGRQKRVAAVIAV